MILDLPGGQIHPLIERFKLGLRKPDLALQQLEALVGLGLRS